MAPSGELRGKGEMVYLQCKKLCDPCGALKKWSYSLETLYKWHTFTFHLYCSRPKKMSGRPQSTPTDYVLVCTSTVREYSSQLHITSIKQRSRRLINSMAHGSQYVNPLLINWFATKCDFSTRLLLESILQTDEFFDSIVSAVLQNRFCFFSVPVSLCCPHM